MLSGEPCIFPDGVALARAASVELLAVIRTAITECGSCSLVLSEGHRPELMYRLWHTEFRAEFPREKIEYFWGDERYVPHHDPGSDYRMTSQARWPALRFPPSTSIAYKFSGCGENAAAAYERTVRTMLPPSGPTLDAVFLGIGEEGHTALASPGAYN
jgi:6-phosphogluconolactonase